MILADQQNRSPQTLNDIVYDISLYYPRNQGSFSIIEYWQPQDSAKQNSAFWKIITSEHTTHILGYHAHAKITDPADSGHIFSWALEESYDACGDHQLVFYKQENNHNVPAVDYEKNHTVSANHYIQFVRYGYDQALHESMVLTQHAAVDDPNQWHFELVFDYGEYDVNPTNTNPYLPVKQWDCRPDPFSSYTAGFEIRTYRRCLHSLLFHRFTELGDHPVLVEVLEYSYQTNPLSNLSFLASAREIGYRYQDDTQQYLTQAIPELLFDYTNFEPTGHAFTLLEKTDQAFLPGVDQLPNYQLVDLYGEGIPGILYADGHSVYYQSPVLTPLNTNVAQANDTLGIVVPAQQAHISYDVPQSVSFPIERRAQTTDITLADMTGDGLLDIVVNKRALKGFYQAKTTTSWNHFHSFLSFPADYAQPNRELIDLVGNNLSDLVQINETGVRVYPSLGYQGFGKPWEKAHAADFPIILTKTKQRWVTFTNIAGSDTPSLVQIDQNKIRYWPSVGYGNFAEAINMGNVPDFGASFDTDRLFLVDIDGSGTTDLIYFDAYWDNLHQGLLAGELLLLDLQRMESTYMKQNIRRFEIQKTISLKMLDETILETLKETGNCHFSLTEKLFHDDYPSHYCRQIKTISLSFPVVLGPYQNIHATLTQTANTIIIQDNPGTKQYYMTGEGELPDPNTVRIDMRANQQIALSQGVNDTGLFELNFNDPRYLPFEGTGAISSWTLSIPNDNNPGIRENLTDVIILLSYTALPGNNAV